MTLARTRNSGREGDRVIAQTQSICPRCGTVLDAVLSIREGRVILDRRWLTVGAAHSATTGMRLADSIGLWRG